MQILAKTSVYEVQRNLNLSKAKAFFVTHLFTGRFFFLNSVRICLWLVLRHYNVQV